MCFLFLPLACLALTSSRRDPQPDNQGRVAPEGATGPRGPNRVGRRRGGEMRALAEFRPRRAGGHSAGRDGTDLCSPF